ncbi:sensor histidine kinase [Anaerosinus massiliensis]|uniref:sensor histidine kinase n=1 Tax=Massilibacillus massiliensis TaxID=1806837 RepID=UPI000A7BA802|nr:ATP-binding protein [Massilibacillus massiliensis]
MLLKNKQLSISIKLTLLYAAMLFFILLLTNVLTVVGLYHVLYTQASTDIASSAKQLQQHLDEGNPVDQTLLAENLLVPNVILKILDEQQHLVVDSAPDLSSSTEPLGKEVTAQDLLEFFLTQSTNLRLVYIGNTYYYDAAYTIQQNDHVYQLHLLTALTEQTHFLKTLTKILSATNLIGLLIAILSGTFISRKILHPLRNITATAQEIQVDDLGKRIPVSHSGDEFDELAKTFNHMLTRLQTGFKQQQRFVADASHELRTPITVISGYVNMLDRWGKQEPQVLEEGLDAIKSEAANMNNLIEKLLYLARADQGKQHLQKTELEFAPFLENIFQETRMIASQHRVILAANAPVIITADESSIKQMLRIFIENSIKYTPPGGTITLASQQNGQFLEITIADTGIGIPYEDQPKIFDRFYRVDKSRSKTTGGNGLGLSIARWIADQHDCHIIVTSTPNKGTSITLQLCRQIINN